MCVQSSPVVARLASAFQTAEGGGSRLAPTSSKRPAASHSNSASAGRRSPSAQESGMEGRPRRLGRLSGGDDASGREAKPSLTLPMAWMLLMASLPFTSVLRELGAEAGIDQLVGGLLH